MVITVVCDVYGEENNGTVVAENNLIRHLKACGHEVRVLCSNQKYVGEKGFYIVPNFNFGKLLNAYVAKVGVELAKPNKDIIRASFMGADHVHIMIPLALGIASAKIAKEMGLSVTAGFHMQAQNFTSYVKLNKLKFVNNFVYKFIYKHMYSMVDGIHYPTKFIRDEFESKIKRTTPGYIISNGVHDYVKKRFSPKPEEYKDKIVVLTTGRYSREKSQDTLIKALKYSKYSDKIQLILGGAGTKEAYYKKLCKKLSKYIKNPPLFKFYSRTEIIDVLNYADIYVHPAQFELEGISCIEAITCGKLTIVSDSPLSATKNFAVDEKCIFKCRNPKSLAQVLDYWIEHPEEKKIAEEKYLKSAPAFNQEECMKKMEAMILKVHAEHLENLKNKDDDSKKNEKFKTEKQLKKQLKQQAKQQAKREKREQKKLAEEQRKYAKKIIYYSDMLNDDFASTSIKTANVDKNFKFIHKNPIWRVSSFLIFHVIAVPALWIYAIFFRRVKFVNKKAIKKLKNKKAFFYGNHTAYLLDACIPNFASYPMRNKIIVSPDTVSIKGIKNLTQMLGALPIPSETSGMKNFYKAVEYYHKKFHLTIYPEAHIWPYYTGVRPFLDKSFGYPVKFNAPVIAFCVCYSKPKGLFANLRKTNITVHLSDPIYPDLTKSNKEAKKELRDKVYNFMKITTSKYSTYSPFEYLPADENALDELEDFKKAE